MFWIKDINIYQLLLLIMDISIMKYFYIFNPFYYENSNNKNPKKPKNTYYDRVYLCVEKENSNIGSNVPIKGFDCFRCNHLRNIVGFYPFFPRFFEGFSLVISMHFGEIIQLHHCGFRELITVGF